VEHLERINTVLEGGASPGMRQVDTMVIRPSEDLGEIATQFRRRTPSMVRFLLRGLGSESSGSSDILSYLMFVPDYLKRLVELGYSDARAEDARLRHFLESGTGIR
jgi:NTE family protein